VRCEGPMKAFSAGAWSPPIHDGRRRWLIQPADSPGDDEYVTPHHIVRP
jgi:hypothetical protein